MLNPTLELQQEYAAAAFKAKIEDILRNRREELQGGPEEEPLDTKAK